MVGSMTADARTYRFRVPDPVRDDIRKRAANGETCARIAERHRLAVSTVRRFLRVGDPYRAAKAAKAAKAIEHTTEQRIEQWGQQALLAISAPRRRRRGPV